MNDSSERPRLLVVVPNKITGDSRVQKTALAAARAGWDVTLLGTSGRAPRSTTWMGPVRVIRHPIRRTHYEAFLAARAAVEDPRQQAGQILTRTRDRVTQGPLKRRLRAAAGGAKSLLRLGAVAVRGFRWRNRAPKGWRETWPILRDWQDSYAPVLVELAPDVIHSNDAVMIGVAAIAVEQLRAEGHAVSWLHDIHEHVSVADWGGPEVSAAYTAYEREYIRLPDALSTVSPELADILADEFALSTPPAVVRNAPIADVSGTAERGLRDVVGVGEAPLVVYSGWIERQRGLGTVVAALPDLPDVHFAIVTSAIPGSHPELDRVLALATDLGVIDRIHLAPYVAPDAVPHYLSSADAGIIAAVHDPNYEISLPTKLPEYLHARLPIVVSDVKTASRFVSSTGVGSVFVSENAQSLAAAVTDVLRHRDEKRAAITDDLLRELSWEHQASVLLDIYRDISGRSPKAPVQVPDWNFSETDH